MINFNIINYKILTTTVQQYNIQYKTNKKRDENYVYTKTKNSKNKS